MKKEINKKMKIKLKIKTKSKIEIKLKKIENKIKKLIINQNCH